MARRRPRFIGEKQSISLIPSFDEEYGGTQAILRRVGGLPLNWWERLLVRLSFRFGGRWPSEMRDPLTPAIILEQLAGTVIGYVDRSAIAGFDQSLGEMVRYHKFLLDIHNATDTSGKPMSFAEFGILGAFEAPYHEWIRPYRRIFERAANKIDSEPDFFKTLSHLPIRLLPRDAINFSDKIVGSILSIAAHEVVFLEKWFTRRTTAEVTPDAPAQPRHALAGSDQRAYRLVVYEFVGAWENTGRLAASIYQWRQSRREPNDKQWQNLTRSWSYLEQHLRITAYVAASAVWNQDQMAADRYRDMLVRWLDTVRPDIRDEYFIPHKWVLLPRDFDIDWDSMKERLRAHTARPTLQSVEPATMFGAMVRYVFDDVIVTTAAVMLVWYLVDPTSSEIAGETAKQILFREVIQDGAARRPFPIEPGSSLFRVVMFMILRGEIGPTDGYGGFLDGLIRFINGISADLMVHGRIYSGPGVHWDDRGSLVLPILGILVATLPKNGDDKIVSELDDIAANWAILPEGDMALRRVVQELTRLHGTLKEQAFVGEIQRCAQKLVNDIPVQESVDRLIGILTDGIAVVEKRRDEHLRMAPLDPVKLGNFRDAFERAMTSPFQWLPWAKGTKVLRAQAIEPGNRKRIAQADKGELTGSAMAQLPVNHLDSWVDVFRANLANVVWEQFRLRNQTLVRVGQDMGGAYWQTIKEQARKVGERPVLLVSHQRGSEVWDWLHQQANPPDPVVTVTRDDEHPTGYGLGYLATVDSIDVFEVSLPPQVSFLFSSTIVRAISYSPIDDEDHLIELSFEDDGDPRNGWITARLAMSPEWDDSPIFEIQVGDGAVS